MPPPPSLPHEELLQRLLEKATNAKDVFDSDGKLLPSSKIWKDLADDIGLPKISPQYLRTYVTGDRWGSLTALREHLGVPASTSDINSSSSSVTTNESLSREDAFSQRRTGESQILQPTRTFKVLIKESLWKEMTPIEKTFKSKDRGSRTRLVIPTDTYTSPIRKLLWRQHKLPCPYNFRHAYVSTAFDRQEFVKFEAICKECGAKAVGRIITEPVPGEDVVMLWASNDSRGVFHNTRQHLAGKERKIVGKELQYDSSSRYRQEIALAEMDPGDPAPPFLYSGDVARHSKSEYVDKQLGIEKGRTPLENLQYMKHEEPFAGTIHDIGADKFFVHYYTPQQREIYRAHRGSSYTTLSIDATASLVRPLPRPHGTSGEIFLFEGVIHTGTAQLSVVQMLNEKQDANSILYWLNEWERSGAKAPHEAVTDDSRALKAAIARSFCRCKDFQELRDKCFAFLTGESNDLPPCYLRLDIAHIMATAKRWDVRKEQSTKRLKSFYLDCLGLLVKATTLDTFREILRHILIVALSPYEGRDKDGHEVPMEASLNFLSEKFENKVLGGESDSQDEEDAGSHRLTDAGCRESSEGSTIQQWLVSLREEVLVDIKNTEGNRINPFYTPAAAEEILRMSVEFPFWSAVLVEAYGSPFLTPSSAPVEGDFNALKTHTLKGIMRPLRVDKFFVRHFNSLDGSALIASSNKGKEKIVRVGEARRTEQRQASITGEDQFRESEKRDAINTPVKGTVNAVKEETNSALHGTQQPSTVDASSTDGNAPEDLFVIAGSEERHSDKSSSESIGSGSESKAPRDLNFFENWRNKGEQDHRPIRTNRPKSRTHLDPSKELGVAIRAGQIRAPKNRLLMNGNLCPKAITTEDASRILVLNTCPFDSLSQIIAAAYIDEEKFRSKVNSSENLVLKTCRLLAERGADDLTYKARAEAIAASAVPKTIRSEATPVSTRSKNKKKATVSITYDCFTNAPTLAVDMMKTEPSVKFEYTCTSADCGLRWADTCEVIFPRIDALLQNGVQDLEAIATQSLERQHHRTRSANCKGCRSPVTVEVLLGPVVLIEIDLLADENMSKVGKASPHNRPHSLKEFPSMIALVGQSMRLAGVVGFSDHHYIGYGRRISGYWEVYNDLAKKKALPKIRDDYHVNPHLLVYV